MKKLTYGIVIAAEVGLRSLEVLESVTKSHSFIQKLLSIRKCPQFIFPVDKLKKMDISIFFLLCIPNF